MSKSQQIINAKKENPHASAADIAALLGVKKTLVYSALSYHNKKSGKTAAKRGRPRKFVTPVVEMQPVQRAAEPEKGVTLGMIHEATIGLQQARAETLEKEIESLRAIIRYLEGKVYGASV